MEKRNTVRLQIINGGIVDDLLVYCIEQNKTYMLVVNSSNIEKDWAWIAAHNTEECRHAQHQRQDLFACSSGTKCNKNFAVTD